MSGHPPRTVEIGAVFCAVVTGGSRQNADRRRDLIDRPTDG